MVHNKIKAGLRDGIPIAVGYFSVSFTFGMLAVRDGISPFHSVLISLLNLTSAGQFAGLTVIVSGASLLEMALTQLVINIRYALMSISLSQKLDSSVKSFQRMLIAYGNTDEIFAVASSKPGSVGSRYMYGLIALPVLGWVGGTLTGAVAGSSDQRTWRGPLWHVHSNCGSSGKREQGSSYCSRISSAIQHSLLLSSSAPGDFFRIYDYYLHSGSGGDRSGFIPG